jgi:hypothetical protein
MDYNAACLGVDLKACDMEASLYGALDGTHYVSLFEAERSARHFLPLENIKRVRCPDLSGKRIGEFMSITRAKTRLTASAAACEQREECKHFFLPRNFLWIILTR